MKRNPLVFLLLVQLALPVLAQTPAIQKPPQPQTEQQPTRPNEEDVVRITTNLVQVDAVITDKSGRQIVDLRSDEIQIEEDGRQQNITEFSYIPLDSRPAPPAETAGDKNAPPVRSVPLRPEQVRRTIALVVDDLGLSFESAHYVRQALKKFLDQQMQPDDLVAIIRTAGGIGALQQFTSDKRLLYAAVEKVKWNPIGRAGMGAFAPIAANPIANAAAAVSGAEENIDQLRQDLFTVGTLGAINYIVRGLRGLPGRKSVLLMSDGISLYNRSDSTANQRIVTALRNLTDLANRASVVIYTMDARGLQPLNFTAADSGIGMDAEKSAEDLNNRRTDFYESQNGLIYLAQQTGGFAVRNNNDLSGGIKRVIDDQKGYYLIGYRPDESTFDKAGGHRKFHNLKLRVTRPGKFNIRMRSGFFGVTDEEAVPRGQTRQQQLIGALISPFSSAGIHLRLTSLFANDTKAGTIMRSMLHVSGRDLTFTTEPDGWHQAVFDILAITFGDNGVVVDQIGRTHTMRVKGATYEKIAKDGFTYNLAVPIKKAGAYQLRTALRDVSSERVGSASQFIEVPDLKKNRLTLSGLMVRGTSMQAFQKSGTDLSGHGENADDTVDESDTNVNPAVRQFKPGLVMVYALAIYNAQLDKANGKPQLQTQLKLFRDGREVYAGKESVFDPAGQPDLKRLTTTGAVQLGTKMEPGEYMLQITVTDLLRDDKHRLTSQWIDFEIVK
ncbi:MAG TPA: VWA domain-containing protein [Pyrinomonadaceae bacterium]|jgi:VWFA-related protein|nr:VWA domain-containing protein [Pyrinomonadaceae bacterium]